MLIRSFLASSLMTLLATSALAQERQWALDAGDDDAYLIFGVPDSDDLGISLWCTIHSDMVKIFLPEASPDLKPGTTAEFTISAAGSETTLKGDVSDNEEASTTSLEAQVAADDPLFNWLLEADRFRVKVAREELIFPLVEADVAGLLALCRKP